MTLEHDDDYQEEEERDEFGSRSIFAAGWFRAALVLTVLAITLVVSLPYLLNWFEPAAPKVAAPKVASPERSTVAGNQEPAPSSPAPAAPPSVAARPPVVTPSTQARPAPEVPAVTAPAARSRSDRTAAVAKTEERPSPPPRAPRPERVDGAANAADGSERYWVQLGAFRDAANAEALAKTVRNEGFAVQVNEVTRATTGAQSAPQRHELFVAQARVDKVGAALKGRGRAEPAPGGVVVKPPFRLEEAMTVSRQLTADGFNVVIRPAGGAGDSTVHVVRAGGYSDRARALAARDALKAKGHDGFVAEGAAR